MTLTDFLLARLAEDEALWKLARGDGDLAFVAGPARMTAVPPRDFADKMLADVEAKRRIVELHAPDPTPQRMVYGTITACATCGSVDDAPVEWPCDTLHFLAQPYADHPDFREEWRAQSVSALTVSRQSRDRHTPPG